MFTVMFIIVFMAVMAAVLNTSVNFAMVLKNTFLGSVIFTIVPKIVSFGPVDRPLPIMRRLAVSVLPVMLCLELLFFDPAMMSVFAAVRPGCTCQ